jgi:uncharacterized protein YjbJ (UPF0337 family)
MVQRSTAGVKSMNLTERFFEMTANVRDQAVEAAARASGAARETVGVAADRVESAANPVNQFVHKATEFNTVVYQYANDMLAHQADMIKGTLHDGARRLRLLAKAKNVQQAFDDQVEYFAVTRDRMTRDAKTALEILTTAGKKTQALYGFSARPVKNVKNNVKRSARKVTRRVHKAA